MSALIALLGACVVISIPVGIVVAMSKWESSDRPSFKQKMFEAKRIKELEEENQKLKEKQEQSKYTRYLEEENDRLDRLINRDKGL